MRRRLRTGFGCVLLLGFAASGCFKEVAPPLGIDAAGGSSAKLTSAGSGAPDRLERDASVVHEEAAMPGAAAGGASGAADRHEDAGACNGAPLRRQGTIYVCDCGKGQTGPFCDGRDVSDDDAGIARSTSGESVSSISSCGYATCALLASGYVRCWGHNEWGALGDGSRTNRPSPVTVKELHDVKQLEVGLLYACAVIADGTLRCWGDNDLMNLRDGTNNDRTVPVVAQGLSDVVRVSVGERQACVRHADNRLECWGSTGREGELDGNGAHDVIDVEAGYFVTTAWFDDGSVRSWGHVPPTTPAGRRLKHITSGYLHICGLFDDGTVRCSGENYEGQLGSDGVAAQNVHGISDAVGIAAGFEHTCAVLVDGTVRCWGQNNLGQLGDGSNDDRSEPTQVSGLDHVVEVTAGREHSCARRDDDSVWCWGSNKYGQLGDGTMDDSNVPVAVRDL